MRAAAGGVTQTGRFQPEQVGHNLAANNSLVPMILVKASRHQSTMRMIIEDLMLDLMYNLPGQKKIRECVITREVVQSKEKPITLIEKAG